MLTSYRQPVYVVPQRRRYSYRNTKKLKRLYKAQRQLRQLRRIQKSFRDEFRALHPKGSAESINVFGPTYSTANERQKRSRRMFNYRGQGDYWSDFKRGGWFSPNAGMGAAIRGLGGALGSYLPGGSSLGTAAGGAVSKWLGFGDYNTPTTGNQLMGDAQTPITVNASDDNTGDLYISHTEFIGNVTASASAPGASAFAFQTFNLNPGLASTFPWLSQIASNFELYDFQGLMFQYKPNSGESGASSNNLGKIIMATQYDPDANAFLNSVEMQNYDYASSTKPSCGLVHGVETAASQQAVNMMYVRTAGTTRDKIFTDLGKFIVATEGIPFSAAGTQILGELWVTYRIKLSRATLYTALLGLTIPFDNFRNVTTGTTTYPASTAQLATKNANLWTVQANTSNVRRGVTLTPDPSLIAGCYAITVQLYETVPAAGISWGSLVFTGNCTSVLDNGGTGWDCLANKTLVENSATRTFLVTINNTNNTSGTVTVPVTSDIPAGWIVTVYITQVSCAAMGNILPEN